MSKLKLVLAAAVALSVPDEAEQQGFWNQWNNQYRGSRQVTQLDPATIRRRDSALSWVRELGLKNPAILDLGCSTGWLTVQLAELGEVKGTDISDAAVREASQRYPGIPFECANFLTADLRGWKFDVVVSVDVLSCVADQKAFITRIRDILKPGGYVCLSTPNRFVYERRDDVARQGEGQVRHWNYPSEIRSLLRDDFVIRRFTTLVPEGHRGILRVANSYRITQAAARAGLSKTLERTRERLGLGQTIAVLAQRKPDSSRSNSGVRT